MILENGVAITYPADMTTDEAEYYAREEIALWRGKGKMLDRVEIEIDGSDVIVKGKERSPIKRIRRITGYLSEMSNFNDAKRAELTSRVTHY